MVKNTNFDQSRRKFIGKVAGLGTASLLSPKLASAAMLENAHELPSLVTGKIFTAMILITNFGEMAWYGS